MDLAVAVHGAVGPGEHEASCTAAGRRPARRRRSPGTSRRPTRRAARACSARNCDDGPPSGSPRSGSSMAKPVENVSLSSTSPAPAPAAAGDQRGEVREVGVAVVPGDVVLDAAMRSRRRLMPAGQLGQALGRLVEHLEPLAEREAHQVPACSCRWRRTPRWGSRRRRTRSGSARQNAMPSPSGRSGRMSTVAKYVASGAVHRRTRPRRRPGARAVALGLQVGGELGEEVVAEAEPDGDGRLERAAADVGEELLGRLGGGDQRRRAARSSRSSSRSC